MKIKIRDKGFRLTLYLPLAIIKWSIIYKPLLAKLAGSDKAADAEPDAGDEDNAKAAMLLSQLNKLPKAIYNILKDYKKEHRKLKLVDIKGSEGEIVEIII